MYQILVIGEAVKRLSSETRATFDQIAWRQMAGMRDVLVHHYDKVDLDIVWEAASVDAPRLLIALDEPIELSARADSNGETR